MESKYFEYIMEPILDWSVDNNASYSLGSMPVLDLSIKKNDKTVFVKYDKIKSSVLITDNIINLQFQLDKMDKKISIHVLCLFFGNN